MAKVVNPNCQRKPIGGHHYHEGEELIKGDTFSELVDSICDFRIANRLPVGDPRGDVIAYYEKEFPWILIEDECGDIFKSEFSIPRHLHPMRDWLNEIWTKGSIKTVTKVEMAERAKGCEGCKYASEIDWDHSIETMELRKRVELLKGMRKTPLDKSYCRLHKWHNGLAVLLNAPKVNHAAVKLSPEGCFTHSL